MRTINFILISIVLILTSCKKNYFDFALENNYVKYIDIVDLYANTVIDIGINSYFNEHKLINRGGLFPIPIQLIDKTNPHIYRIEIEKYSFEKNGDSIWIKHNLDIHFGKIEQMGLNHFFPIMASNKGYSRNKELQFVSDFVMDLTFENKDTLDILVMSTFSIAGKNASINIKRSHNGRNSFFTTGPITSEGITTFWSSSKGKVKLNSIRYNEKSYPIHSDQKIELNFTEDDEFSKNLHKSIFEESIDETLNLRIKISKI